MKNLVAIFLLAFPVCSFAQSENKFELDSINELVSKLKEKGVSHLRFKDIPISGNINSFVDELKKQEYKILKMSQESAILSGRFTGENAYILVQATPKSVYGVTVMFDEKETWKSIKSQYDNYKILLTKKYGEPIESQEKFDSDIVENTETELYALKEERYNYYSFFKVNDGDGTIKLSISPNAQLVINYVDTINFLIAGIESQNDL